MHFEILVEDQSGHALLELLLPEFIGNHGDPHTWNLHPYRGIGRIPPGLGNTANPATRMLLNELPRLLRGYRRTPGIDAVVVVLDADSRDCRELLEELQAVAEACDMKARTLFRIAIEEVEAWYFGDRDAILEAYPKAKRPVLDAYIQDSICGTWEMLADVLYPGGSAAVKKHGWPLSGQLKYQWANEIGICMNVEQNLSPSFCKLRDGIRRLAGTPVT